MSLDSVLATRIRQSGPISVADFMADCLLHPRWGYYVTRDPLGAAGDFTTAPEISQMFGELIGLCLAQTWMDQGRPASFTLAELGPGRGTLMADLLRATSIVPGFLDAAGIALVEASPVLRAAQKRALAGHDVRWLDRADALPDDRPLFVVANEFFDALPIRQFLRDGGGWRERLIGLRDGALCFGLGARAARLVIERQFGRMAAMRAGEITDVPLAQAVAERKVLTDHFLDRYESFFLPVAGA